MTKSESCKLKQVNLVIFLPHKRSLDEAFQGEHGGPLLTGHEEPGFCLPALRPQLMASIPQGSIWANVVPGAPTITSAFQAPRRRKAGGATVCFSQVNQPYVKSFLGSPLPHDIRLLLIGHPYT